MFCDDFLQIHFQALMRVRNGRLNFKSFTTGKNMNDEDETKMINNHCKKKRCPLQHSNIGWLVMADTI